MKATGKISLMKLLKLSIKRFRGIRTLDWHVGGKTSCLLGPGDSSKSTILTAIEYCFYSGWGLQIFDADFFEQDTSSPIEISATLGNLPSAVISDSELGMALNGFDAATGSIVDEPSEGLASVVVLHFRVRQDLEPEWYTKRSLDSEEIPLGNKRKHFRVVRLTEKVDADLGWARNSALAKITTGDGGSVSNLPDVFRAANDKFAVSDIESLRTAATALEATFAEYGITASGLQPGLLQSAFLARGGAIGLFENKIPVLQKGLGTKRLAALALQKKAVPDHAIILVDEIETGLEPYRIEGLLRVLGCLNPETQINQLIFTTHSPTPILKLPPELLHFVRSDAGNVSIKSFPIPIDVSLKQAIKNHGVALLARNIVVGEGKTEFGMIRELFGTDLYGFNPLWSCAGDVIGGGGNAAAADATMQLQKMGYNAFLLADSDAPINPDQATVEASGAKVYLWPGSMSTEERIAIDLPDEGVAEMFELGKSIVSEDAVNSHLKHAASEDASYQDPLIKLLGPTPPTQFDTYDRSLIGRAAKKGKWFKTIETGELLGALVGKYLSQMSTTPTVEGITSVQTWLEENKP